MTFRTVTVDDAIDYLNTLGSLDGQAVAALIGHRVPCNAELAEHPTCQVGGDPVEVGMLGVLNGLFGVDADGWGAICACYDDTGELVGFKRTERGI